MSLSIFARGEIRGGNSELLTAPLNGSTALHITFLRRNGEAVKAGDVVVQFDTADQEYALKEAQSDLAERNIEPSAADWSRDRPWITSRLKQEIATQACGVAAGNELEMRRDPQVQVALQALRTDLLANAAAAAHY